MSEVNDIKVEKRKKKDKKLTLPKVDERKLRRLNEGVEPEKVTK